MLAHKGQADVLDITFDHNFIYPQLVYLSRSEASGLISGIVGTVVAQYFEWSISFYNVTYNANTPEIRLDNLTLLFYMFGFKLPYWDSCYCNVEQQNYHLKRDAI